MHAESARAQEDLGDRVTASHDCSRQGHRVPPYYLAPGITGRDHLPYPEEAPPLRGRRLGILLLLVLLALTATGIVIALALPGEVYLPA